MNGTVDDNNIDNSNNNLFSNFGNQYHLKHSNSSISYIYSWKNFRFYKNSRPMIQYLLFYIDHMEVSINTFVYSVKDEKNKLLDLKKNWELRNIKNKCSNNNNNNKDNNNNNKNKNSNRSKNKNKNKNRSMDITNDSSNNSDDGYFANTQLSQKDRNIFFFFFFIK